MTQPKVDDILLTKKGFPIFGSSLSFHLASFPLASGIAFPIQLCVTRLVMLGLEEEGLFRLAAGSSKVKRLRAEMEAGLSSLSSLETADHHVLTATIKSYLRELPDPLMGAQLYQDWVEAGQLVCMSSGLSTLDDLLTLFSFSSGYPRYLVPHSMIVCQYISFILVSFVHTIIFVQLEP